MSISTYEALIAGKAVKEEEKNKITSVSFLIDTWTTAAEFPDLSEYRSLRDVVCKINKRVSFDNFAKLRTLTALTIRSHYIETLDLTKLTLLRTLDCSGSGSLQRIRFCPGSPLESIDCSFCNFAELDLAFQNSLTKLVCQSNRSLKTILLAKSCTLTVLDLSDCDEFAFDSVFLYRITRLICGPRTFSSLRNERILNLKRLILHGNGRDKAVVSHFSTLESIESSASGSLPSVTVKNLPVLKTLDLNSSKTTTLRVKNCPALYKITAIFLHITEFAASNLPSLTLLSIHNNVFLKELAVENCPKIVKIDCTNCSLVQLRLTPSEKLQTLKCCRNDFDFENLVESVTDSKIQGGSFFPLLQNVECDTNNKKLILAGLPSLQSFVSKNPRTESFVFSGCSPRSVVHASGARAAVEFL